MAVFVRQRCAVAIFSILGCGKRRGDADTRFSSGRKLRHPFYPFSICRQVGIWVQILGIALDEDLRTIWAMPPLAGGEREELKDV